MFSRFFINRPIFACVVSIVIMLLGGITYQVLPVEQTPDITPPTVLVSTTFPGANADVLAETVAMPIEAEVNGVEDMIYMSSKCSDDGKYELTVTFEVGTDIDMATVLTQNRVTIAEPRLPEEVKRQGVKTEKQSTNMVLMVNMISPGGGYNEIQLSNYVTQSIKDVLARVPGVGKVTIFGAKDYSMRIWLNPERMKARDLSVDDVLNAIREQNVQVAAGQIGAPPSPENQQFQYTINTQGRLREVSQFENIVLKVGEQGQVVRVRDVAEVKLGAELYNTSARLLSTEDDKGMMPSIAVGIYQLPGANSLQVSQGIREEMKELAKRFPDEVDYKIAYDTTMFIDASIEEVKTTLLVAVLLVILTVYVFLQDFRTTLIPAATIPVSLIGTFAVMGVLGISVNTLSLFGLVLAIGIVVDDAIVVVENTMRLIDEEGLSAKEATAKAMEQVTGPVVATTLVLLAVFIPTAMMSGITGRLYAQFAMTIAAATVFSSINALTLSPALCGMLLRPTPKKRGWFFTGFNNLFDRTTRGYMGVVNIAVRRTIIAMLLFAMLGGLLAVGFQATPSGFIPDEDQGYFMVTVRLPDGAALVRTERVMDKINEILMETEGAADIITITGYSALDTLNSPNTGTCFVTLKNWSQRGDAQLHVQNIVARVQTELSKLQEGITLAFMPPPITGLGAAGGFEYQLQLRSGTDIGNLAQSADFLVFEGNKDPVLTRMNSNLRANVPQLYIDVDRVKAKKLRVPLNNLFSTLQTYLGSAYINDFNRDGRVYKVTAQAESQFRNRVQDIDRLYVRDEVGNMVPLSTLVKVVDTAGPQTIFRFQMYPSATITGQAAEGFSSGQAIEAMKDLSGRTLPPSMDYAWSGVTYQQIAAGSAAPIIFGLAIAFVFLFLSAQYESWTIPLAVLLSVPLAILGAIVATLLRQLDNNIYTQIGLVLLIGLSAKSAILIVEFAKQKRAEGESIIDAAAGAAHLRFRAILMTAFSFILGVVPLVIASGAGAASRQSLGTAVFGGMLAATIFGVFFIPVLYVVVQKMSEMFSRK